MLKHLDKYHAILTAAGEGRSPKLKPNTFARHAKTLRAAGLIVRQKGNGPYHLTEKGQAWAKRLALLRAGCSRLERELEAGVERES